MPKTTWDEIAARMPSCYLLVGRLDASFGDGPRKSDPFDSLRVRFAVNLMARCCRGLALPGSFALQGSRDGSQALVQFATDDEADFRRLGLLTSGIPTLGGEGAWKAQSGFVLDEALHDRLLKIAGAPDDRGAGRRARARDAANVATRSLRW